MNNNERASGKLIKVLAISIILIFLMGIGVMATSAKLTNIKIILANDYEMTVITAKTNVAEILRENNIVLEEDEVVSPSLEEEIGDNKTIRIQNVEDAIIGIAERENIITKEEILSSYGTFVEKLVTEQVSIPFETITKEATGENGNTQNRVIQAGREGLKEVTYKIKYKDDEEIERTEISSVVLREPVDRIVEVRTIQVTSRSGERVSGDVAEYQAYAREKCYEYGWNDDDFDCLVLLWNRESNWRVTAQNRSSGAYGIPQSLPASKMASAGSDYLTNYKTQIDWGLGYIKGRYGDPTNAWAHSQRTGWY